MPSLKKSVDHFKHEVSRNLYHDAMKAYMKSPISNMKPLLFDIAYMYAQDPDAESVYLSDAEMKKAKNAVKDCSIWSKKLSKYKIEDKPKLVRFGESFRVSTSSDNPIDMLIAHGLSHNGYEGKELIIQKTGDIVKVELIEEARGWYIRVYKK